MRQQAISFIYSIAFLLVISVARTGYAEIIHHEEAIEADEIVIIGSRVSGSVMARQCEQCPLLRLQLTQDTEAYSNGQQVPMSSVPIRANNAITVIYDPKTNRVNKIKW